MAVVDLPLLHDLSAQTRSWTDLRWLWPAARRDRRHHDESRTWASAAWVATGVTLLRLLIALVLTKFDEGL